MTNEQAKQEAIKNSFGKSWDMLSYSMQQHILNVHHWVDRSHNRMNKSPNSLNFDEQLECEVHCEFWRPIQLKGIENNNGWIRIEPDGSNLPTDGNKYDVFVNDKKFRNTAFVDQNRWLYEADGNIWVVENVAHYKPITPELKPIY